MLSARPGHLENATGHHHQLRGAPKTPGRQLKSSVLRENAQSLHKVVLGGKQTPFRGKAQQSTSKVLGDKTPFHHNRQDPLFTPAPQSFKFVKFALEEDEPEILWPSNAAPASNLLRPFSARKSLRGRLSGDGDKEKGGERFGPLGLKGLKLQTPMNPKNRHWDVGELDLEVPVETEPIAEEEEEDDEEIEYMPPKVEVPYQPPFDFEMPDYKALGAKLREMAHSYKYEDDPVLDDFDYVFDISPLELELLRPVDPGLLSEEDEGDLFFEPSTSTPKLKQTPKANATPSMIPKRKVPPAKSSSQKPVSARTRGTVLSTSTTRPTRSTTAVRTATTTAKTTATRTTSTSRPTAVTKPTVTARPVRSSATAKAISPRKQFLSRATTSQVRPMKPLVPVQKQNTTRSEVVSRPPSSATTRKVGAGASTLAPKKPTSSTLKAKEDDLILKFDIQEEVEEFQFDV